MRSPNRPKLRRLVTMLAALNLMLPATGCMRIALNCEAHSPAFDALVAYRFSLAEHRYEKPLNAWVENEALEQFLRDAYRKGSIGALQARYGLNCASAEAAPPCGDCYVCRAAVAGRASEVEMGHEWDGSCRRVGTVSIEARIGPGPDEMRVMTYWQRPPVGADSGQ
jgi:hypothetical protein